MPRTNDKTNTPKAAKKKPAKKKGKRKAASLPTVRGDGGFCIGGEWTPRGDE